MYVHYTQLHCKKCLEILYNFVKFLCIYLYIQLNILIQLILILHFII